MGRHKRLRQTSKCWYLFVSNTYRRVCADKKNGAVEIDDDTRDYIITEKGKNFINKDGVCEDCLSRKDEIDTMEYWKLVGLPQSGFSMCQYGCGCKLVEVKK